MHPYPVRLTCHVRAYAFGHRLMPEMLDKKGVPEGTVEETWEVSDYRETIGNFSTSATIGNWIFMFSFARALKIVWSGGLKNEGVCRLVLVPRQSNKGYAASIRFELPAFHREPLYMRFLFLSGTEAGGYY